MKFVEQVRSDEREDEGTPRLACAIAPFRVSKVQNIFTPPNLKPEESGRRKADSKPRELNHSEHIRIGLVDNKNGPRIA